MAIRAVVFDLFDTLVDLYMENFSSLEFRGKSLPATAPDLYCAVNSRFELDYERFAEALIAVDRGLFASRYGEGLELPTIERFTALALHLGLPDPDLPGHLTDIHMSRLREHVAPIEHHAGVLESLSRSVSLGVCSNFSHAPTAHAVLREASLYEYFDAIVISETVGIRKPRPEIFAAVLDELDVSPDEVLHVGDNLRADVEGASRLGIRTAWITRRVVDQEAALERYDGPDPTWQLSDLVDLVELIECEGSLRNST